MVAAVSKIKHCHIVVVWPQYDYFLIAKERESTIKIGSLTNSELINGYCKTTEFKR